MIATILQTIGQIGLHIFTETVGAAVAKGGSLSLAKIGDINLVKIDKFVFALAGPPPPLGAFSQASPAPRPDSSSAGAVPQSLDEGSRALQGLGTISSGDEEFGDLARMLKAAPPFRTGLSVMLDHDHRLTAGFRTLLSPSVLFVAESAAAGIIAFQAFDYDGVDVKLRLNDSTPFAVHHFQQPLKEIVLDEQTPVTTNTRLSLTEIAPNTFVRIEDRLPVVIAPLSTFPGRVWHLCQHHPARDTRHYLLALLS